MDFASFWFDIWEALQPTLETYGTVLLDNALLVGAEIVVSLLLIGSAAVAATIAELRYRSGLTSFALGLIVPVIYPVFAFVGLTTNKKRAKAEGTKRQEQQEKATATDLETGPPPVDRDRRQRVDAPAFMSEEELENEQQQFDQAYFMRIGRDEAGDPVGPFNITVEGRVIRAERIVECLPKVAVVETVSGGRQQKLRLPYAKVEAVEEL